MNAGNKNITIWLIGAALTVCSLSGPVEGAPSNSVTAKISVLIDGEQGRMELRAQQDSGGLSATGWLRVINDDEAVRTRVNLVYLSVDGEYAWFAGKCTSDEDGLTNQWVFVAVHDGGEPGSLLDHMWWEWLGKAADAETLARQKVETYEKPADSVEIHDGNIIVK